jgi:hypothetical protein
LPQALSSTKLNLFVVESETGTGLENQQGMRNLKFLHGVRTNEGQENRQEGGGCTSDGNNFKLGGGAPSVGGAYIAGLG